MGARLPLVRALGRFRQLPAGDFLPVVAGGTGATDAAGARDALGLVTTTSTLDSTVGRLLKVGDFGVGSDSIVLASTVSWDTITTPGRYYIPLATGTNAPIASSNFFLDVTKAGSIVKQMAVQQGTAVRLERALLGGTWITWDLSYTSTSTDNISWISPTLMNGWTAGARRCSYRKRFNAVELVIGLYGANGAFADGTIIFNLPAGYRPSQPVFFPTATGFPGSRAQVDPNGDVTIYGHTNVGNFGLCISFGLT
jgi:hypothetical protein